MDPRISLLLYNEIDTHSLLKELQPDVTLRSLAAIARVLKDATLSRSDLQSDLARYVGMCIPCFFDEVDPEVAARVRRSVEKDDLEGITVHVWGWISTRRGINMQALLLGSVGRDAQDSRMVGVFLLDALTTYRAVDVGYRCYCLLNALQTVHCLSWVRRMATEISWRIYHRGNMRPEKGVQGFLA